MIFIPNDDAIEAKCLEIYNSVAKEEGFTVVGWRDVPIDVAAVGEIAKKTMPRFKQIFIQSSQVGAAPSCSWPLWWLWRPWSLSAG
jgi:glutamate synthase domain-containing protein 1